MTITLNPKDVGHDGTCDNYADHGGDCGEPAIAVMLSACPPDGWAEGSPAASIAFLCAEHLDDEPVALIEHAEHNAREAEGPSHELWAALLDCHPKPIHLAP